MTSDLQTESSDSSDPRADRVGRRGQVDRRHFLRLGLMGTAVASASVMANSPSAGAAMLQRSLRTTSPRTAALAQAGNELALQPGLLLPLVRRLRIGDE